MQKNCRVPFKSSKVFLKYLCSPQKRQNVENGVVNVEKAAE